MASPTVANSLVRVGFDSLKRLRDVGQDLRHGAEGTNDEAEADDQQDVTRLLFGIKRLEDGGDP